MDIVGIQLKLKESQQMHPLTLTDKSEIEERTPMPYRMNSGYYVPRSKADLIKEIKPRWKGLKGDLQKMSTKRLRAIFCRIRQETIDRLLTNIGLEEE